MANSTIGAQMYTLRDHLKTPADIGKTCKRVRDMGYEALQVSAFGEIEPAELGKILKDNGLTCAATHVSMDMMRDVNQCVEYHEALGCKYPAIGGYWVDTNARATFTEFGKEFSAIAKPLAERGLRIGYHNHSRELAKVDDGDERILDLLIEHTDPSIWFEIDTYWIAHGGGDPAAWIDKVAGRIPAVHFKDMAVTVKQEQRMCEIGDGNLNWPAILQACKAAGVEWYLVERDTGDLDPFDSLKRSLDNMRAMGLE